MNGMQVFENPVFGQVRTVTRDGEPWFVLKDVCTSFGETNYRRVSARLDEDEKGVSQIDTPGGNQSMTIVNESGLYAALFAMQPEKARGVTEEYVEKRQQQLKSFKRWITHEVIPAIRKTGSYTIAPSIEDECRKLRAEAMQLNARTRSFKAAVAAMKDFNLSQIAMEAVGIPLIEDFTGIKTGYRPQIERTYSATEIAQELGVSANLVGKTANENGLKTEEYGVTVLDKAKYSDKQLPTFRYNERGRQRLKELLRHRLLA